jgi:hypothetical protein
MMVGYPRRSRVREHTRLLGILWLALSAFNAVAAVVLFILANTLFLHLPMTGENAGWLHPFFRLIAWVVVVKAAAGLAAGWGLLQREPWARIVCLIMGFLALLNIPFGTALGVYTLWVLLPAEADEEYSQEAQGAVP